MLSEVRWIVIGKRFVDDMPVRRSISLDLLRVIAMCAVVVIHVYSLLPEMSVVPAAEVMANLSRWAVPVFFMISGAFMLNKQVSLTSLWSGNRIFRLIYLLLFWNYFYWLLRPLSLPGILKCTFDTGETHMWFMYTLILLYALVPLFQPMVKSGYGWYFVAIWFLLDVLLPSFNFTGDKGLIYHFKNHLLGVTLGYSGYFVLGHCIVHSWDYLKRFSLGIYMVGASALVLSALIPRLNLSYLLGGGNNVLYVLSAYAIFCFFLQMKMEPSSKIVRLVLFLSSMSPLRKDLSILRVSNSISLTKPSVEYPLPKSSTATENPLPLICSIIS